MRPRVERERRGILAHGDSAHNGERGGIEHAHGVVPAIGDEGMADAGIDRHRARRRPQPDRAGQRAGQRPNRQPLGRAGRVATDASERRNRRYSRGRGMVSHAQADGEAAVGVGDPRARRLIEHDSPAHRDRAPRRRLVAGYRLVPLAHATNNQGRSGDHMCHAQGDRDTDTRRGLPAHDQRPAAGHESRQREERQRRMR